MIYTILLLTLCQSCIGQYWHFGGINDTPEVSAAKVAHFAAIEKAKLSTTSNHLSGLYKKPIKPLWKNDRYGPTTKYSGPIALPPGYDKYGAPLPVQDTPEVASAKAKHLAVIAQERARRQDHLIDDDGHHFESLGHFDGQFDGHFDGHNDFYGHGGQFNEHSGFSVGQHESDYSAFSDDHNLHSEWTPTSGPYGSSDFKYNGPIAFSPGYDKYGSPLPVLDTPEVLTEKEHHFAAFAKIAGEHELAKRDHHKTVTL